MSQPDPRVLRGAHSCRRSVEWNPGWALSCHQTGSSQGCGFCPFVSLLGPKGLVQDGHTVNAR